MNELLYTGEYHQQGQRQRNHYEDNQLFQQFSRNGDLNLDKVIVGVKQISAMIVCIVKLFLFVGQKIFISCISWVGQCTNLRFQLNIYPLNLY